VELEVPTEQRIGGVLFPHLDNGPFRTGIMQTIGFSRCQDPPHIPVLEILLILSLTSKNFCALPQIFRRTVEVGGHCAFPVRVRFDRVDTIRQISPLTGVSRKRTALFEDYFLIGHV
jgi:hypothetical protein